MRRKVVLLKRQAFLNRGPVSGQSVLWGQSAGVVVIGMGAGRGVLQGGEQGEVWESCAG